MADISIADVTTTLPTGDGVFDVLMRSIDSHLDKQYMSGRIKGSDYATVYLGALQAVLQQSIAFVLAEQKAEKEVDLLTGQVSLVGQQLLTETENTTLVGHQAAKVAYETANILPKQALLIEQQELTETQNTRLVDTTADIKEYEFTNILPEQLIKIQEEIDLLQAQDAEILANTIRQDATTAEQIAASQAATALKQQLGNAQTALYQRQTTGFNDDYQYKVFKALMDMRTTGMTQEMAGLINGADAGANKLANEMLAKSGLTGITNILADVV